MPELSAAVSAFFLIAICLSLASLLVCACHDAERPLPPSYMRALLTRPRIRYWKR